MPQRNNPELSRELVIKLLRNPRPPTNNMSEKEKLNYEVATNIATGTLGGG